MKKTRIIIPALAMIAFSVAASITGTVAWFTANRTVSIDAGTYAVVKTSSDLSCTVADGIGTTATNSGSTHGISVTGKLTDGSFDHVGTNHYIYAPNLAGTKVSSEYAMASATAANLTRGTTADSKTIYTAVTWDVTFTVQFSSSTGNIGLFLDLSTSVFTPGSGTIGANNQDTAKGFRMAFIPTGSNASNGVAHVFADLQEASKCTYVGGEPAVGGNLTATAYSGTALIDSSDNSGLEDVYAESSVSSMNNYFGKFVFAENTAVSLQYKVVCWFEGTDENIVNGDDAHVTVFRDVTAHLDFAAINLD